MWQRTVIRYESVIGRDSDMIIGMAESYPKLMEYLHSCKETISFCIGHDVADGSQSGTIIKNKGELFIISEFILAE